ncbi:hypothetical protein [Clostridium tagluense]|uniref:Uncharacterized protein n=1 Tax=Clostridium tagluense TaxID=360422 RepID=A0A401UQM0_9CLOT|nr:hypothetical protein [Clostridium tagluense]GCD11788.1 hypothetical protein Ctaglu_34110 [Clostridium tagluense]
MINLKYFDTIRMLLRSGKTGDEYIQKTQPVKIVLSKCQLEEIPDLQYHVRIAGYTELNENAYQRVKIINSNQFLVNYENGMVYFNSSEEGKTVTAEYKGRGLIQYPAERIYVNNTDFNLASQFPYVIDNLQKYLNFLVERTKELTEFVATKEHELTDFVNKKVALLNEFVGSKVLYLTDFVDKKVIQIKDIVSEYEDYVEDKRVEFTDYVDDYIDVANDKIDEMDVHIIASDAQTDDCREQTRQCKIETDRAIIATNDCIITTDDSIELYNQVSDLHDDMSSTLECAEYELVELKKATLATRLIMQSPVSTLAEVSLVYLNPEIGWAVQTEDTGNIYRWNGVHWMYAYNLQSTISPATDTMNGIMTKEQFNKLVNIEEKSQVNYIGEKAKEVLPTYFKIKTVVFILAEDIRIGSQGVYVQMPFNGTIADIRGFCKTTGADNTVLKIEKASESDFLADTWTSMFKINENLIIPTNSRVSLSYSLLNTIINRNDYLRINIVDVGIGIRDITIQVNINI